MTRDHIALAAQYQADVLSGAIPACKWVRLACERNRRDLDRQETADFPYRFDADAGRRICQMAEMLPHIKGEKATIIGQDDEGRPVWNPIQLEPWQCWLLTTLFGWLRVSDGRRRFRIALSLIPRKNAKSTLAAVVVLYMLVADGESGAECYSAATTRDQAKAIAEIAWEMAKRSPAFRDYFGVRLGSKTTLTLTVPATGGKFAPLSADANSLDGLNVSLAAIDELHAHRKADVWNVLDTATGARAQPLIFAITTAGVDIGGVCHQKLAYLEKVLDGVFVDEAFFGINYTIDPGDDIRDVVIQRKANPNFGVSVNPDDLARKVHAASQSPAELNDKLTKHFNVWIRTESSWMTGSLWQSCTVPGWERLSAAERYAEALEQWKGFPCWIGVDLAEVRDIAALIALFKIGPDSYGVVGRFYLPQAAVDKSPIAQLQGWVREGSIIETEGDQADFARIQADIVAWCDLLQVKEIDFDRALAAQMQQDLKRVLEPRMGRDAVEKFVVTVPQRVEEMDPAMKKVERLVLATQLQHDGNPAMAWMISNIVVERNYKDEIYPRKAGGKDSPNKIDGPVALFTCMSRAMAAEVREPAFQIFITGGTH
jgi:phage terminase large subunit-like protein